MRMHDAAKNAVTAIAIAVVFCLGVPLLSSYGNWRNMHERNYVIKNIEWRNAFWTRVTVPPADFPDANDTDTHPVLTRYIREQFLSPGETRVDAAEWNKTLSDLREEDSLSPVLGIFDGRLNLTDESIRRIGCIQTKTVCEPKPVPPAIDPATLTVVNLFKWRIWLSFWLVGSVVGYAILRIKHEADAMLGITDHINMYVRRGILAIVYAPELLVVLAYRLLLRGCRAAASAMPVVVSKSRAAINDLRNPYWREIRQASRALALLKKERAPEKSIASAERLLSKLRSREVVPAPRPKDRTAETRRDKGLRDADEILRRVQAKIETDHAGGHRD